MNLELPTLRSFQQPKINQATGDQLGFLLRDFPTTRGKLEIESRRCRRKRSQPGELPPSFRLKRLRASAKNRRDIGSCLIQEINHVRWDGLREQHPDIGANGLHQVVCATAGRRLAVQHFSGDRDRQRKTIDGIDERLARLPMIPNHFGC